MILKISMEVSWTFLQEKTLWVIWFLSPVLYQPGNNREYSMSLELEYCNITRHLYFRCTIRTDLAFLLHAPGYFPQINIMRKPQRFNWATSLEKFLYTSFKKFTNYGFPLLQKKKKKRANQCVFLSCQCCIYKQNNWNTIPSPGGDLSQATVQETKKVACISGRWLKVLVSFLVCCSPL